MENIFKSFVVDNELYVNEYSWEVLLGKYEQKHIIQQISDAIVEFEIKLPYRVISYDDAVADYQRLLKQDKDKLSGIGEWGSKFDYKYSYNHHYIENVNAGNKASDYFHQVERWKCDATGYPSPQKTWETERFRLTLFKALFSLKVKEINPTVLRNIISLRKYIAAQFRPSAAKYIYDYFQAETVLDFSMGWGDRILGAHASEYVKKYVGFDPNQDLMQGYVDQIIFYQNFGKPMKFKLHPWCAEDTQIVLEDEFDLVWSCEFVEHVDHIYIPNFLTQFIDCDILVFTHAVKYQIGHHHVNCQDQEYWIELIEKENFAFCPVSTLKARELAGDTFWQTTLIFKKLKNDG